MKLDRKKVELALARAEISTRELCKNSGVPNATYVQCFSRNSRPVTVGKIAHALSVDVTELLVDEHEHDGHESEHTTTKGGAF